jgi:hypothetical protein
VELTPELVEIGAFLRARWDERTAAASGLHEAGCGHDLVEGQTQRCDCGEPARTLRRIEGLRKILSWIEAMEYESDDAWVYERIVLRGLAVEFADHPEFQEEWRR